MQLRNVLVMLVFAILGLVAYLVLKDEGAGATRLPNVWPSFANTEVTEFTTTYRGAPNATMKLRRKPGAGDRWELLTADHWVPASTVRVEDFLSALARQDVSDRYEAAEVSVADRAEYLLNEPVGTIELTAPGRTIKVRYGRKTLGGESAYADGGDGGDGGDVWVVVHDAMIQLQALHAQPPVLLKMFDDVATYDVEKVEVESAGARAFAVAKDDHVWKVTIPYEGFAEPTPFERLLAALLNSEIRWEEFGAPDVVKYGLDNPRAKVTVTSRGGREAVLVLGRPVDAEKPLGESYVLREGADGHVAVAPARMVAAALADPAAFRDRSFTRLGIDCVRMLITSGDVLYQVERAGTGWDITKPHGSGPAEYEVVEALIEDIAAWPTISFEDDADAAAHHIGERGVIEIERQGGELVILEFGDDAGDSGIWARRKGDGGPEIVSRALFDRLLQGLTQFRKKNVRHFFIEDMDRLARFNPPGQTNAQDFSVVRDLDGSGTPHWLNENSGQVGDLDRAAIARILAALQQLKTIRWLPFKPDQAQGMGFVNGRGSWFTLEISYADRGANAHPGGDEQTLAIGNKAPGGRFARFTGLKAGSPLYGFAFVLSDEIVLRLAESIFKIPKTDDE